jgi:hypothetical protein
MLIKKKVSLGGEFAKIGEDIKDGGEITIFNAGQEVTGDYGTRMVFKVETQNGEKLLSFNQTSLNNMVDEFGEDSDKWVGKMIRTFIVKSMVSGKLRNVVYLAPLGWDMLEDGSFAKKNNYNSPVNDEDIPII